MSSSVGSQSPQLTLMRKVAEKVSRKLVKYKNAIGVILVGSVASGRIHEKSDMDLIVVCDAPQKQLPSYQLREAEGFQLEIHYNSIERAHGSLQISVYRLYVMA